jgi:hypothetical protein
MANDKKHDEHESRDVRDEGVAEDASVEGRRKALRKLLVGGGIVGASTQLPDKWMKPLVDSVLVPAHAQTSVTPQPTPNPTPQPTAVPQPSPVPTPQPTVTPTPQPTPAPTVT